MSLIATSSLVALVSAFGIAPEDVLSYAWVHTYAIPLVVAITGVLVLVGGRTVLMSILSRLSSRTTSLADNALLEAVRYVRVLSLISIAIAMGVMASPTTWWVTTCAMIAVITLSVYELARAVGKFIEEFGDASVQARAKKDGGRTTAARSSVRFVAIAARAIVWIIGFLFFLSNVGIDITSLIAGLGVGGIIIGFALQAILQDLFSSFSIHFDKPFEEGDFIIVGSEMGTIEKIGVQSTRIRALQGEQIIVPNKDLMSSRIKNYQRMNERRVVFTFRISLETPTDALKAIPRMVRDCIDRVDATRFDRAHVQSLGDDAFIFEVVYYVLSSDYNLYMDINQDVLLAIRSALDERRISLAYPTRLIDLRREKKE